MNDLGDNEENLLHLKEGLKQLPKNLLDFTLVLSDNNLG